MFWSLYVIGVRLRQEPDFSLFYSTVGPFYNAALIKLVIESSWILVMMYGVFILVIGHLIDDLWWEGAFDRLYIERRTHMKSLCAITSRCV